MSSGTTVYVGNLDQRVNEDYLREYFSPMGEITNAKIIIKRFATVNFGFVEYADPASAQNAIQNLNGMTMFDYNIKVDRSTQQADQSQQPAGEEQPKFQVFVGDLAPEITNEILYEVFNEKCNSLVKAHVMMDNQSGNSRGFGFVTFQDKASADSAIASMNGELLGSRNIRVNWAAQKSQQSNVTSVYVGNLPPNTSEEDLRVPFQDFGNFIQEIKVIQGERGCYAFVKFDNHENAENAIFELQDMMLRNFGAKLSWGKEQRNNNQGFFHNNNGYMNNGNYNNHGYNNNGIQQNKNWRFDRD